MPVNSECDETEGCRNKVKYERREISFGYRNAMSGALMLPSNANAFGSRSAGL